MPPFPAIELPATPVLEVLFLGTVLGKAAWRDAAARAEALRWPRALASHAGRVDDAALWIDAEAATPAALQGATALAVHDVVPGTPHWLGWYEGGAARPVVHPLRFTAARAARLLDLQVRGPADAIELWVDQPAAHRRAAAPPGPGFRIAVLRPGAVVRVRRNHKTDFSMTGRRERTYTETDCLVRHAGTVDRVVLATRERAYEEKPVRLDEARTVDLRHELH